MKKLKKLSPYTLYLSGILSENQYLSEIEAPEDKAPVMRSGPPKMSLAPAREPKSGDKAYSVYNGKTFVGVLYFEGKGEIMPATQRDSSFGRTYYPDHLQQAQGYRVGAFLMFPPFSWVKNPEPQRVTLSVSYDGPIVWDQKEGMFYAPADSD